MPDVPPAAARRTPLDPFRARALPYLTRRNYVVEMQHLLLWGIFAGIIEGNVCAVVAAKTFGGSILLITVVSASPMFANLVSLAWGVMCRGRRRMVLLTALSAAAVTCAASIGATPASAWGGWLFALQIALARVFTSGVITVRTSLWRSNYPQSLRGLITGRLQFIRTGMSVVAIILAGAVFDAHPEAYRWVYPAGALIGVVAVLAATRTHVRGERAALRIEARVPAEGRQEVWSNPFEVVADLMPHHIVRQMLQVLRRDRRFARYCFAQSMLGSAAMVVTPIFPIIFTRRLDFSYVVSNALLDVLPQIVLLLTLGVWGVLFDRVGVLRFRVVNAGVWLLSIIVAGMAAWLVRGTAALQPSDYALSVAVFVMSRIITGIAMSGGAIAWNIGHLHFAGPHEAELYMGIHVSLTGLRGLIAPFLGAWVFAHYDWWAFILATVLGLIGLSAFRTLARADGNDRNPSKPTMA